MFGLWKETIPTHTMHYLQEESMLKFRFDAHPWNVFIHDPSYVFPYTSLFTGSSERYGKSK